MYIDTLFNKIVFDKYKMLDIKENFVKEDVPKQDETREVEENLSFEKWF